MRLEKNNDDQVSNMNNQKTTGSRKEGHSCVPVVNDNIPATEPPQIEIEINDSQLDGKGKVIL